MWARLAARYLGNVLLVVLLAGLACATMVRFAPGFGTDERMLDPRLRADTLAALRQENRAPSLPAFYAAYLWNMARGDLGFSKSLGQPVGELLIARLPVTARNLGLGLAIAWAAALALAALATVMRWSALDVGFALLSGAALCVPAAVIATLFAVLGWPTALALAVVMVPRLFRFTRNLLEASWNQPWVLTARVKGLGLGRILARHVLPGSAAELAALAGASLTIAFGALIPIEVLGDSPGIGQLAWQAALGRDLPLLVSLTALVTLLTVTAGMLGEVVGQASRPARTDQEIRPA